MEKNSFNHTINTIFVRNKYSLKQKKVTLWSLLQIIVKISYSITSSILLSETDVILHS